MHRGHSGHEYGARRIHGHTRLRLACDRAHQDPWGTCLSTIRLRGVATLHAYRRRCVHLRGRRVRHELRAVGGRHGSHHAGRHPWGRHGHPHRRWRVLRRPRGNHGTWDGAWGHCLRVHHAWAGGAHHGRWISRISWPHADWHHWLGLRYLCGLPQRWW